MSPWLRVLEAYLIQALLRTPAFHRGVEKVAHRVHRFRNNLPPEPPTGTSLEDPANSNFIKHFGEEIQTQLGRAERREAAELKRARRVVPDEGEDAETAWRGSREEIVGKSTAERGVEKEVGEGAEDAWKAAEKTGYQAPGPKGGFLGEYIDALRDQVRKGK